MANWPTRGTYRDSVGNAVASPTVTVYLADTLTLATIYSDRVGTALANPFTGNADGTWEFYSAAGQSVKFKVEKASYETVELDWVRVGDDVVDAAPHGATVGRANSLSIPNAVSTTIPWETEEDDDGGLWSVSPNPERLTPDVAGWYVVSLNIRWTASVSGGRVIRIRNAAGILADGTQFTVAGFNMTQALSAVVKLAAGEYVYAEAFQDSGGPLNLLANQSRFSLARVSDAS